MPVRSVLFSHLHLRFRLPSAFNYSGALTVSRNIHATRRRMVWAMSGLPIRVNRLRHRTISPCIEYKTKPIDASEESRELGLFLMRQARGRGGHPRSGSRGGQRFGLRQGYILRGSDVGGERLRGDVRGTLSAPRRGRPGGIHQARPSETATGGPCCLALPRGSLLRDEIDAVSLTEGPLLRTGPSAGPSGSRPR